MLGLRWTLGIATVIAAVFLFALALRGGTNRQSLSGSDKSMMSVLPLLIGVVVVSSLLWPERRALLHAVAVLMIGVLMGAVFIARHALVAATLAIVYASAWLFLYFRLMGT